MIEKSNDFYRTDRRSMAWNRGWLPPSRDALWGDFLSVSMDEERSIRVNKAWDAIMPMNTC